RKSSMTFRAALGKWLSLVSLPADFQMNGETIKKGSWILVTKVPRQFRMKSKRVRLSVASRISKKPDDINGSIF
ncbi:hypothetical protein, partial [Pseudomonas sp. L1(2025)]|uniref:hypothetical protein n=1 Tax=Pseudomonas sp. L1(2025) TaxID=3449429 RepID=UPI003F68C1D5